MTAFSAAINRIFNDPNMAADAVWLAGGSGPSVAVRVIRKMPDEVQDYGMSKVVSDSMMIDVRVSDVSTPQAGDIFNIGDQNYRVQSEPRRDREGLIWSVALVPAP